MLGYSCQHLYKPRVNGVHPPALLPSPLRIRFSKECAPSHTPKWSSPGRSPGLGGGRGTAGQQARWVAEGTPRTAPGEMHLQFRINLPRQPFKGQALRDTVLDEIVFAFPCKQPLSLRESDCIFVSWRISVCRRRRLSSHSREIRGSVPVGLRGGQSPLAASRFFTGLCLPFLFHRPCLHLPHQLQTPLLPPTHTFRRTRRQAGGLQNRSSKAQGWVRSKPRSDL